MARSGDQGGRLLGLSLCAALLALAGFGATASAAGKTVSFGLGLGTRATGLTAGPDGNLWFFGSRYVPTVDGEPGDVVGSLTPSGRASEIPLPAGSVSGRGNIVAGADGNLWFTDVAANRVGRVTPLGQVEGFALPTAGARPGAITAGPGGSVWFVEEAADKVGRATAAGIVAEFPLPAGAQPTGIAEGPDGALWIAERGRASIARMSAAGAVTEYELPDPSGIPHAIVAAPDGNLWFSEEGAPRVGRISPAGEITEFQVSSDLGTRELAVGGDGNLWFTTGNAIGSISTDGEVGEPACIERSCSLPINALAKGPEGALWFAGGLRRTEGGGGALLEINGPGVVGKFFAPPLSVRVGRGASRVRGGLTTVAFSCHGGAAGEACAGVLKLTTMIGGRTVVLSRHRYLLGPTTGRRLPLGVGSRGATVLSRRGKLVARVVATLEEGAPASRKLVLRSRPRR